MDLLIVPEETGDLDLSLGVPGWALDDVPFGIGVLKVPELEFVYSNRLYESWYRPDRRPIVGKRLQEVLVAAPQVAAIFQQVADRGEPAHFHDSEFVGLQDRPVELPGGVTRWDWSIWPLTGARGTVTHLLVSGYDVTASALDRLRLSQAHEAGIRALIEVSRVAGAAGSIEDFFGKLSETVGRVVGARKVLFARVTDGTLAVQPATFGFDDNLLGAVRVRCRPDGEELAERIVFQDEQLKAEIVDSIEFEPYRAALDLMEVSDAIAVSWRVGDVRLGLVAAFNSTRQRGFEDDDFHLLKTAAMAAGLVWQHRDAQARLEDAQEAETRRLKQSADDLAALEHRKAEFLRFASHEMRSPLSVLNAYASMLADGSIELSSESVRQTGSTMATKVRELNRMVDQILEVSRLEDPTVKMNWSTFDLRAVVAETVEHAQELRGESHLLRFEAGQVPVEVRADRERIEMILSNLVDNAIKYSPSGTRIDCGIEVVGDAVRVSVSDAGVGISDQDVPKLFSRFSRVGGHGASAVPGTGLGLYLCREAARLHGGEIELTTKAGSGSTFTLVLPLTIRR